MRAVVVDRLGARLALEGLLILEDVVEGLDGAQRLLLLHLLPQVRLLFSWRLLVQCLVLDRRLLGAELRGALSIDL